MLSDEQIERYARQVVLPEVGGRGQERLLASRVAVAGGGVAARRVADLLRRAGVTVVEDAREASVLVDLGGDSSGTTPATCPVVHGTVDGACATLTVLPGPPCPVCHAHAPQRAAATDPLAICALHALSALAANEALLAVLAAAPRARRYTIDLSTGSLASTPLTPAPCPHGACSA